MPSPQVKYDAYESVTVSTASVGFTAATRDDRKFAIVTVESAAVRFRVDGTAPTATEGHVLEPGDLLKLDSGHQVVNARFIRRDGADATIRCSFGY